MKLSALVLVLSLAATASAQSSDTTQRALDLGYEGDALYTKGDFDQAFERFSRADALAHSPVFVLYMARSRKNVGRWIEARDLYRRTANEKPSGDVAPAFRDAIADAKSELADLERKIPRVIIEVTGRSDAVVKVDGTLARKGVNELDPGAHTLTAESGTALASKRVTLDANTGTLNVTLDFPASAPKHGRTVEKSGPPAPALVAIGVGVAGLAVGSVTGLIARSRAKDLESRCTDNHCPRDDADDIDSAKRIAMISTVSFVIGGVALATGGVWLALDSGAEPKSASIRVGGSF